MDWPGGEDVAVSRGPQGRQDDLRGRRGNDYGTEYRTGIYYTDPADKAVIDRSPARLQKGYTAAEDYHQDYLEKNPGGYCHIAQKLFDAAAAARPD